MRNVCVVYGSGPTINRIYPPTVKYVTALRTSYVLSYPTVTLTVTSTNPSVFVHLTVTLTTTESYSRALAGTMGLQISALALLVGLAILAVASRRKGATPSPARVPSIAPVAPPALLFCTDCGAPIPAYAAYCRKCGSKQQ